MRVSSFDILMMSKKERASANETRRLFSFPWRAKMPKKPKRPCSYQGCGKLTDGQYCDEHKQTIERQYNRYLRDPETNKRYGRAWKKLRARFLLQHPLCQQCKCEGRLAAAEEVHHILPLANCGTNDDSNLMALCKSCHSRITITGGNTHR